MFERFQSGIMVGSSAGQKKAPICTKTCAAHTTATSLAGERANVAKLMAMTIILYHISIILEI